jgi:hypothetical protein
LTDVIVQFFANVRFNFVFRVGTEGFPVESGLKGSFALYILELALLKKKKEA